MTMYHYRACLVNFGRHFPAVPTHAPARGIGKGQGRAQIARNGELDKIMTASVEILQSENRLINAVNDYYSGPHDNGKLKFLFTSRPYEHIQRGLSDLIKNLPTIHFSGDVLKRQGPPHTERSTYYDGAPAENLVGLDKDEQLIELGFDLFRDRATLYSTFLIEDFLKPSAKLAQIAGHIHVINSGYFLHLWDFKGQVGVAKCMVSYLFLQEDDLITGVQLGREDAGLWKVPILDYSIILHNSASFSHMWNQIEEETGTRWLVWSTSDREGTRDKLAAKGFRLRWFVRYKGRQSQTVPGESFSIEQAD
ncbi:hypothetical protein BO83DRAFT_463265 [Aspergillus eucalypticola CBS 122712]|uniref:Uncharacterized protein n=1 Tax=Aspergillus eucalypticola (strain CBS 122712 / IBT 29274) TaxID=1448314 RepID=A0A317VPX9_ASPEC|nr:uncharacterized protein BO83DRAFT_463265 [Aspergillus eucalypticola CBS 122712]PWY75659.1 hypothetical protein BO83DRAFT_463265 [Aspergillus eucalypticola CBS 122712]